MLFDRLCSVLNNPKTMRDYIGPAPKAHLVSELERLRGLVASANLFHLDIDPADNALMEEVQREHRELLDEQFYLPFPVVAVEDKISVVVLRDTEAEQVGVGRPRLVLEFKSEHWYSSPDELGELEMERNEDGFSLSWGTITSIEWRTTPTGPRWRMNISAGGVCMGRENRVWSGFLGPQPTKWLDALSRDALAAVEEIACSNLPSRWILEQRPVSAQSSAPGRLARSSQRPVFTVLEPGAIRRLFGSDDTTGRERAGPIPHARRRHMRTYRSERFQKSGLQGKTVFIPATWVGPSEAQVDGKRYIVRLDL